MGLEQRAGVVLNSYECGSRALESGDRVQQHVLKIVHYMYSTSMDKFLRSPIARRLQQGPADTQHQHAVLRLE